jgi:molecular chaperone GrpE
MVRPGAAATSAAESAPVAQPSATQGPASAAANELEQRLAERTTDLQRLKAEYDNYRRRVERDRLAVAEQALASVLLGLLPILDDIERARLHGELEGGFKSVADGLEATLAKLGLVAYGAPGDPFDPTVHEALMHSHSAEVSGPTCVQVLARGYRLGNRVLRPARVAVAEPRPAAGQPEADSPNDAEWASAGDRWSEATVTTDGADGGGQSGD